MKCDGTRLQEFCSFPIAYSFLIKKKVESIYVSITLLIPTKKKEKDVSITRPHSQCGFCSHWAGSRGSKYRYSYPCKQIKRLITVDP